jgi:uncharacterized damage-inducible protein DinB
MEAPMEISTIEPFLAYFESVRGRTLRVAAAIPPEQIEWRPREGAWSFGDLLRHLGAIERYMFAENACGRPSSYPGHGRELADGHAAVMGFLARMHEEAMGLLRELTPEDLARPAMTPGGARLAAWKWLRAMVEHEAHHRGQIYLMLGMLGVKTPPLYGLTEEEVKARSVGRSEVVEG